MHFYHPDRYPPLVSGYDSDSDYDNDILPSATLRNPSKIVDSDKNAESDSLKDDPPLNGNKRKIEKLQIRIGSLNDNKDESKQGKRTKLEGAEKKIGGHSLLNILPAPKNREPFLPAKKKETSVKEEEDIVNKLGVQSSPTSGAIAVVDSELDKQKAKGNDDFRAMLGLKPSSEVRKATKLSQTDVDVHKEGKDEEQNTSIAKITDPASLTAEERRNPERVQAYHHSSLNISAAPNVESEPFIGSKDPSETIRNQKDSYSGWQQGPNGEWFPITPEAHQEFQQYLFEQSQKKEDESNLSHHHSTKTDTDRDGKNAFSHLRIAGQRQSYIPTSDQSEEQEKKEDKSINLRAKRKGQLSSLIVQAEEKKDQLEKKWAKGRSARNEAKNRYGF